VGFTTGFVPETGSPLYRVELGLSWRKTGAPGDPDADGIWGVLDDCPHVAEDRDDHLDGDGCPDPDDDNDGVPDVLDRCPAQAEDVDDYSDRDGCPDPDNDFDGLIDSVDDCRDEAGPGDAGGCPDLDHDTVADKKDECSSRPGARESFGCPDADNDRVPDYRDLCPSQAVSSKVDPFRSNGCPSKAYLGFGRIELLDRVNFDFGLTNIRDDSHGLLRDVARILKENPSILLVEIGGHTDNVGSDAANLRLSRSRAKEVRAYLISQGIDPNRLEAKGYGESRPVDTNLTEAGRYQNRRVEFLVLKTANAEPPPPTR
jgi:outer membrane protein OmpA-like peptidoglycan-associated protein